MTISARRAILLATVSSAVFLHSLSPALAAASDDQPQTTPETASGNRAAAPVSSQLDEVIVTAQKRAQPIDSVGMAITALTATQLKDLGVTDVAGLAKIDPSFAITQSNWGAPVYQIRGVSYNDFSLAASPTVSVYTDEVPYAYPVMSKGATFDLDRVEVLKGPQGTLYGQNATGGAVNYIAAKPTNQLEGGLESTWARFNAVDLNGFISGPLTDTLKARLSFSTDQGGAWQKSYTRDDSLGNKDTKFGRLILDWAPTSDLKMSLNVNGWTDNSQTQAGQLLGIFPSRPAVVGSFPALVSAVPAPQNAQAADWIPGTHPANDESYYQTSLRADYTVSDNLSLTYLGSYEHYNQNDLQEPQGAEYELYLRQAGVITSDVQEVRVNGTSFDNRVIWVLGANYTESKTNENEDEDVAGQTISAAFNSLESLAHLPVTGLPGVDNVSTDDSVSKAVFGNVEYHPTSEFNLHAGARYNSTDISHGGCTVAANQAEATSFLAYEMYLQSKVAHPAGILPVPVGGCATIGPALQPYHSQQTLDQDNVSWRAGLDWTPTPKILAYVSASKGYKAGDFPTLAATTYQQLAPVVQESVLDYEGGVKTKFFEGRLKLDGDVFYYDYQNKQLEMRVNEPIVGLVNALLNVPRATETGAEFSAKFAATENLVLSLHATYIDSDISKPFLGYNPFSTVPINMEGESFPNVPKWALGADAQYTWTLNQNYVAYVGANARYQSRSQGEFGSYQALGAGYVNTSSPVQPGSLSTVDKSYAILDLRAGLISPDGHWHFQVFGNNVTNTYYWTDARLASDSVVRFTGMPMTFGATVGYEF